MQEVNLTSVYLCCKAALPHMLEQGRGSIINTASFVAVGARSRLVEQRRATFRQRFVRPLLAEAARLGLTPAQVEELISQEEA